MQLSATDRKDIKFSQSHGTNFPSPHVMIHQKVKIFQKIYRGSGKFDGVI